MYQTNRFCFLFRKSVFDRFRPFSSLLAATNPQNSVPLSCCPFVGILFSIGNKRKALRACHAAAAAAT
jgi:hypothetical protein